jgi:hypothetical protein
VVVMVVVLVVVEVMVMVMVVVVMVMVMVMVVVVVEAARCDHTARIGCERLGRSARHRGAAGRQADALAASSPCIDCPPFLTRVP